MAERIALSNRIGAILTTLGIQDYDPLRRNRRERLDQLRTALGAPLPVNARTRILRLLERLELVLAQVAAVEAQRDAVLKSDAQDAEQPDRAAAMIRQLAALRGIGVQSATTLVRKGFVRHFRSAKVLGAYAGLVGTPFASGALAREQGIDKGGNRRLRTTTVELAWLWLRYQPNSALSAWFRLRLGQAGGRMRKVLVVALARKLLIALWRFACAGIVPQGVVMPA